MRQAMVNSWGFVFRRLSTSGESTRSISYMYHINARVLFSSADSLVIDFGLLAFSEASADLQLGFKTEDFATGHISLAVDPYFYFERLSKIQSILSSN
jgi:hypothetical protein